MTLFLNKGGAIVSLSRPRFLKHTTVLLAVCLLWLSVFSACAMDVNTASLAQLETLHGVGPRTAKTIIQERERGGSFSSLEDLSDRVRGIGKKRLARLRSAGLTAGGGLGVSFSSGAIATPEFSPPFPSISPRIP